MTTAGRPTWTPAVGGAGRSQGGNRVLVPTAQYSSKDLASHTKLKSRQPGQQTKEEIALRDLKAELLEKEQRLKSKDKEELSQSEESQILLEAPREEEHETLKEKDIDADDSESEESSSESESDEEDDTAELLKELDRIKKEREEEARRQTQQQQEYENQEKEARMMQTNPLLQGGKQDFNIKKRWYDDTVFRNQARTELKVQKRFINDTIRNDFHRKFLHKYIQ